MAATNKQMTCFGPVALLICCLLLSCSRVFGFEDDGGIKREPVEDGLHREMGKTGEDHGNSDSSQRDHISQTNQIHTWVADIDTDSDGHASVEEILQWILRNEKRGSLAEVNLLWSDYDTNSDGAVEWAEYQDAIMRKYGVRDADMNDPDLVASFTSGERERFHRADLNKDSLLDKSELQIILFPHHHDHMVDHLVDEMLKVWDKDEDGIVSLEEYKVVYEDMFTDQGPAGAGAGQQMDPPATLEQEVDMFRNVYDKNGDGKLDREEVAAIVAPSQREDKEQHAEYMHSHSDKDKDGKVSHEEMLENAAVFMSEMYTEGVNHRSHEEL